ncbi:MAG: helix-hairpin-helix domain-containing protein, partial [Phycisphaerales bacterium]
MASNAAIAEQLALMAQLLEILGENKFKVIAHQKGARVIEGLTDDLATHARAGKPGRAALLAIDGIGPSIADKIVEFVTTGVIADLDTLKAKVPTGLLELLSISGMGPKTVAMVWKEAGVTDLAGLKRIIADGTLATLPRMGEKAVEKIKAAIEMQAQSAGRLLLGIAHPIAERIAAHMAAVPGVSRAAFAGSLRRGKETIGDIDILAATTDPSGTSAAFCSMPGVRQVISQGENKCSVMVTIDPDLGRWGDGLEKIDPAEDRRPTVQVDLRIIPDASWGAAMMYFTGSKEHNVRLRERANKMGLTLNEFGLFQDDDDPTPPQRRGLKPVASRTEEEIFRALKTTFVPPELREDRGELALKETPRLIEPREIRAELHAHTTASDGRLSIEALAKLYADRGFHTLAITDHSQSSAIAGGLKPAALRDHIRAIRGTHVPGITLLTGSEVDILATGELDYKDDLLAELDVVVASPHASLS